MRRLALCFGCVPLFVLTGACAAPPSIELSDDERPGALCENRCFEVRRVPAERMPIGACAALANAAPRESSVTVLGASIFVTSDDDGFETWRAIARFDCGCVMPSPSGSDSSSPLRVFEASSSEPLRIVESLVRDVDVLEVLATFEPPLDSASLDFALQVVDEHGRASQAVYVDVTRVD